MMLRSTSLLLERLRFFFFFLRSFFSRLRSFFFRFFSLRRRRRDSELSLELELLSSSDMAGASVLVPALHSPAY